MTEPTNEQLLEGILRVYPRSVHDGCTVVLVDEYGTEMARLLAFDDRKALEAAAEMCRKAEPNVMLGRWVNRVRRACPRSSCRELPGEHVELHLRSREGVVHDIFVGPKLAVFHAACRFLDRHPEHVEQP